MRKLALNYPHLAGFPEVWQTVIQSRYWLPLLSLPLAWFLSGAISLAAIVPTGDVNPAYPVDNPEPWDIDAELAVGQNSSGSLLVDGGSQISSDGGNLGFAGTQGILEITGPGSEWVNSQNLMVGVYSKGSLQIRQGAVVRNVDGSISDVAGESEVIVEGIGSQWLNSGNLYVGTGATGSLAIAEGGSVGSHAAWIGLFTGSQGTVTVAGEGSTWEIEQSLSISDVGSNSQANLSLTGAGSRVYLGDLAPAVGDLLPTNETALVIAEGASGNVNLSIFNGNSLQNSGNALVAPNTGQAGQVLVSGTGSQWINEGSLLLGGAGTAQLTLAAGGAVTAVGGIEIGTLGNLVGQGQLTAQTNNQGRISPGLPESGHSIAQIAIAGSYVQALAGNLALGLQGNLQGEWDSLAIAGAATLAGTLEVTLEMADGGLFQPQLGDSFTLLTATDGITGTFGTPFLPLLDPGLGWQLDYQANELALTVITELAADFDYNGTVEHADLLIWENYHGTGTGASKATGDADLDGDTGGNDFLIWQRQLGSPAGPTGGQAVVQAVPEPAAVGLYLLGTMLLFCTWKQQ